MLAPTFPLHSLEAKTDVPLHSLEAKSALSSTLIGPDGIGSETNA